MEIVLRVILVCGGLTMAAVIWLVVVYWLVRFLFWVGVFGRP